MDDQPTCGKGLAANAGLPAALGAVAGALGEVLTAHQASLDVSDPSGKREYDAYQELADAYRSIASQLAAAGKRMTGYRDLPMGPHDIAVLMAPPFVDTFAQFVRREEELLARLQAKLAEDRAMLGQMQATSATS